MSTPRLTETSYIVLGLLEQAEPATPYDLKRLAQLSTNNFWSVPHTQLYTECARLAGEGLLDERQEQTGRRRRIYRLTAAWPPSARGMARRTGERSLRTARRGDAEAVLRRRPGAARRDPAGGPWAPPEGLRTAARTDPRGSARSAARPRARDRPRAGVHPLLVAAGRGRLAAGRAPLSGTGPPPAGAAAPAPGPSSSVTKRSRPSRITTGSRESLARARSAVAAAASATASHVACSLQAGRVGASAPVIERLHAGEADRHVELAVAPGAAEAVGDQHGGRRAGQLAQARADAPRRGVGVARQQDQRVGIGGVGGVDAGVGAHEAVAGAADQHAALGAQDLDGLVEHDLDRARVAPCPALAAPRARARARSGARRLSATTAPSALRDGLVRDHDQLPVAQPLAGRAGDQRREVVAGAQLGEAGEGPRADGCHHALAVNRCG